MNDETVDKVLNFFRDIIAQLGPAGEQAYEIIKVRVIAESITWFVVTTLVFLFLTFIAAKLFKYDNSLDAYDKEKGDYKVAGYIIITCTLLVCLIFWGANLINLISPDYATIQRVLTLVSGR